MKHLLRLAPLVFLLAACTPGLQWVPGAPSPSIDPSSAATATALPTHTASPTLRPTTSPTPSPTSEPAFSFVVTSDMSHYSAQQYLDYPNFFAALLRTVKQIGPGDFMVSTGDVIPGDGTDWTVDQVLGFDYPWYPLPGNHDFDRAEIQFFENYAYPDPEGPGPDIIHWGTEPCQRTTYSFDHHNAHFVALNVYCDADAPWGIDGSITDILYEWLAADLAQTEKEHIFVFGHEPAFPHPDVETGQANHVGDSLDQYPQARDRFWSLLQAHQVVAYIHGHTHTYSAVPVQGVWELDAGQSMGVRAAPSPGTFLRITVQGARVVLETYRGEAGPGFGFRLYEEIQLRP